MSGYRPGPGAENRRLVVNPRDGFADLRVQHSCGQCRNCRINARSHMATRCVLESKMHPPGTSWFLTLTFAPEHRRESGSLRKADLQGFIRRVRDGGFNVRFKGVGEYGEGGSDGYPHPHYHVLAFNLPLDDFDHEWKSPSGDIIRTSPTVARFWPYGIHSVGALTAESAGYVSGYSDKKITGEAAPAHYERVDPATGQVWQLLPEFSLQSLKPGIGLPWFKRFAPECLSNGFIVIDGEKRPIPPYFLRHVSETDAALLKVDRRSMALKVAEAERLAHEATNPDPLSSMSRRFVRYQISELRHEQRVRNVGGVA